MAKNLTTAKPTKLDKLEKLDTIKLKIDPSTKPTKQKTSVSQPSTQPKSKSRLQRRTFMLDEQEIAWLEQTAAEYRNKPTLWSVSKSGLVRLGIRLLQEQDLDKVVNRIRVK